MNCWEFEREITAGGPLSPAAQEHLRACPACSKLAALGGAMDEPAIGRALENRIVGMMTANLERAEPLAPAWQSIVATLGVLIAVIAAGVLMLGTTGWDTDSTIQRVSFAVCLTAALLVSAVTVTQLQVPGGFLLLTPVRVVMLGIVCSGAGIALYPLTYYDHFVRSAAICFVIGTGFALVAGTLMFFVVRRGMVVSRFEMTSLIALAAGVAGMTVLYIFCPHRDSGHMLLGHLLVPVASTAAGAWFGRRTA